MGSRERPPGLESLTSVPVPTLIVPRSGKASAITFAKDEGSLSRGGRTGERPVRERICTAGRQVWLGLANKVTGPGASAIKYDILTALLVTAARGDPVEARLSLRLSLLITARFNWRRGTFAVGQREMARMWGVTERTAKREMAEMRARRWIAVAVPAARGRVTQYRIETDGGTARNHAAFGMRLAPISPPAWRMRQSPMGRGLQMLFRCTANLSRGSRRTASDGQPLPRVSRHKTSGLRAWFAPLQLIDLESGVLTLMAPNRFQADYVRTHFHTRILAALVAENRSVREVQIICSEGA